MGAKNGPSKRKSQSSDWHGPKEAPGLGAPREAQERLESILALSGEWYWEQDEKLRFKHFFGRTSAKAGANASLLIGKTRWDLPGIQVDPADRAALDTKTDARQPFIDHEYKRVGPDGSVRYFRSSGHPLFDAEGRFRGYRGIAKEVTQSRREERLLALEHQVSRSLAEAEDVGAALKTVIRVICETEDWECGQYWRSDENALRFGEYWCAPGSKYEKFIEKSRDVVFAPGVGLIGEVLRTGEPLWVADVAKDRRLVRSALVREIGSHGAFVFPPVNLEGKIIGVLAFSSTRIREPDERLLQAVRVIAAQIGQFLERKRAEEARRHAERLQNLHYSVALKIADAESVSAAMTAAIRAICEAEGWECGRFFRLDNDAGVLRFAESWGVDEPAIQEFIERSRDIVYKPGAGLMGRVWQSGQPLWIADVTKDSRAQRAAFTIDLGIHGGFVFPVKSEGRTIGVLAFNTREIREADERLLKAILVIGSQMGQFLERKRAEEELRRFRAAIDSSADLMMLVDPVSLRYLDVNDAACRALGYSREELLHMGPPDIFSTVRDELVLVYARMIAGQLTAPSVKGRYRRKDGTLLDVEAFPRAVKTGDGHVIVSIARDITERLATEETLRRFRVAMDNSADMIVLIDRATMRFVDMNNTTCHMLGYTREELLKMGPQDVLPTGREELERMYDEFIADPTHTHGMQSYYRRKDGTAFAFESTRHVLRSGDTYLIAAISRDITPRIEAEEALRSSEERFRSLTSLSSDIYWEQDEQFRFTSMSGTGSSRVNLKTFRTIGKKRWEQNYINMTADQWADHIALLEAHREFRDLELCRLDESGNKVWISISGEPVFDSSGAFRGYRGVGKDITERKLDEERIQFLANHDALTSLPNRTMFNEVLTIAVQNARRYKRAFAVLFIDLDRFKNINDTLGHDAGDKLLQQMGKRLTETMRTSDIVARLGGDEFVVLVQEINEAKQVASVARKVLSALVQPMYIQGQECRVTASIGICMYPSEAQDELAMMKNADIAMYRAKEDGKNNYKFYSEEMNVHSFERLALETSLRRALERSEFLLHYQAKADLRSGRITGVEALVRWQHPDLGLVPPAQFIPLAEETGLIVAIGKWVLHTACAQSVAWQKQGLPPVRMAVNLSARQFADDDLVKDVVEALSTTGLRPDLLELELTESVVIQNTERAGQVVNDIKKLGVRLAIDDFGVGYSSLTHLKRFPIDTLKVDRSFIRDLPEDAEDKAITEAIIAMGKSLNLTVVAEGVETEEQQTFLQKLACDEMQGYYFSKPIAGDAFAEFLRQRAPSAR